MGASNGKSERVLRVSSEDVVRTSGAIRDLFHVRGTDPMTALASLAYSAVVLCRLGKMNPAGFHDMVVTFESTLSDEKRSPLVVPGKAQA